MTAAEAVEHLTNLTGRTIRMTWLPVGLVHAGGRLADALQRRIPIRIPVSYEMVTSLTADPNCDDDVTREELGIEYRPLDDTVADTIRWMVDEGLITKAQAGWVA